MANICTARTQPRTSTVEHGHCCSTSRLGPSPPPRPTRVGAAPPNGSIATATTIAGYRTSSFPHLWLGFAADPLTPKSDMARDFSVMPILADALQDAGCDNDDVLNHCREPGP